MNRVTMASLLLSAAACAGGTPDGKPAPFERGAVIDKKVLTGPEGVRVRLAQTDTAALLELTRVRPDLDGVVLLTELDGSTSERGYSTELNGGQSRLVVRRDTDWTLYIGGPMRLEVDAAASAALDPGELIDRHVSQRAQGRLAALARFDVDAAQTGAESGLAAEMGRLAEPCGFAPETSIDWTGLGQDDLGRYSIASYCESPRSALERACAHPELKAYLAESAARYVCRFGAAPGLALDGGTLTFTVHFATPNQEAWAREALDRMATGSGRTVRQIRLEAATRVCAPAKGDARVVVGPSEDESTAGVASGRGGVLYRHPPPRFLGDGWFFEPRYPNPKHNPSFRGYDLRFYSYVDVTPGERMCRLQCGPRTIALREVLGEEKRAFLDSAEWRPVPNAREPYALARDKAGAYYFVDRGATAETEKDFRLFIGPQGRLRLQKMKDVVSDSEGEIFASANGRLKLLLGKADAEWQAKGRTQKLVRVDVRENLALIYERLGVYLGQPLYTPCDDL